MTWRRATKQEALRSFPIYFTLATLLGLPIGALFDGAPNYEETFYRALWFALAMAVASLFLKLRAEAPGEAGPATP